jgi:hypothetical protein
MFVHRGEEPANRLPPHLEDGIEATGQGIAHVRALPS